ncbi:MAG: ABC transporter permease [Sulfolobales archaeon]|nr:ABC transporter permease [Sulfolobales archaeon]MCX8186164.1 ABC transporter permease [Sulfolobales archaeon]MDW7969459.1 ABC transporter permease [Sulfolobales archaeon]
MEEILDIVLRSVYISGVASFLAFLVGFFLVLKAVDLRFKEFILSVFEALIGVPTTVIGLLIYLLIFPRGPLGTLNLLYTPYAIILGEFLVALPVVFSTLYRPVENALKDLRELVISLGGNIEETTWLILRELLPSLVSSFLMGFSRAIGELGVALIVGGNIAGSTRVLTTTIALMTSMGEYETAVLLGLTLVSLVLIISIALKLMGELRWK